MLRQDYPSLCGICAAPAKGYLVKRDNLYFGACSMAHQKKLTQGEKLKNVAQLTEKGLDYALAQTKEVYVKYGKKNKKFILHEWNSEDRRDLFRQIVREYLNYANKQAEDGVNIGTDKIHRD